VRAFYVVLVRIYCEEHSSLAAADLATVLALADDIPW
jgi:hypothetical protein